jgi:hypothetical protein
MQRLLESEIVTQSVYNADAEWDGECCWSWSKIEERGSTKRAPATKKRRRAAAQTRTWPLD